MMNLLELRKYVFDKQREYPKIKEEIGNFYDMCLMNISENDNIDVDEDIKLCLDNIDVIIKLQL